jgi:hypothetical protein
MNHENMVRFPLPLHRRQMPRGKARKRSTAAGLAWLKTILLFKNQLFLGINLIESPLYDIVNTHSLSF